MKAGWKKAKLLRAMIALLALGLAWQPLSALLTLIGDPAVVSVYLQDSGMWRPILPARNRRPVLRLALLHPEDDGAHLCQQHPGQVASG